MNKELNELLKKVLDLNDADLASNPTRETVAKWDSLTHMDLVVAIENKFSIQFETDDIIAMTGVEAVRNALRRKGIDS